MATLEQYFTFDAPNKKIIGYDIAGGVDVDIPETIGGVDVLTIGFESFLGLDITSVIIPDSVTSIEGSAFKSCTSLTTVVIPSHIKSLGDGYVFRYAPLVNITLGADVAVTGVYLFGTNGLSFYLYYVNTVGKLEGVYTYDGSAWSHTVPPTPFEIIFDEVTQTITGHTGNPPDPLILPDSINGVDVLHIANSAFQYVVATELTLPASLLTIGTNTFQNSTLTELTIPTTVTSIGNYAFYQSSSLELVGIGDNVTLSTYSITSTFYNEYINNNASEGGVYHKPTSSWEIIFGYNLGIIYEKEATPYVGTVLNIPNTINGFDVKVIDSHVYSAMGLTEVSLPNTLITIGNSAFYNCSLTSIAFPQSLESIENSAFRYNDIVLVEFPDNPNFSCSDYAFDNNANLNEIICYDGITLSSYPFGSSAPLIRITLPADLIISSGLTFGTHGYPFRTFYVSEGSLAGTYEWNGVEWNFAGGVSPFTFDITTQTITDYDVSIGGTEVTIPTTIGGINVLYIGDEAFKDKGITRLSFAEGVISIGERAFENNLIAYNFVITSIAFPDSLTSIADDAFKNSGILRIKITDNITNLGTGVFDGNDLVEITLGNGLTNLPENTFSNNIILSTVTIPIEIISLNDNVFQNCPITKITIEENVTITSSTFGNFGADFKSVYDAHGQLAYTYEYIDGVWRDEQWEQIQFDNGFAIGMTQEAKLEIRDEPFLWPAGESTSNTDYESFNRGLITAIALNAKLKLTGFTPYPPEFILNLSSVFADRSSNIMYVLTDVGYYSEGTYLYCNGNQQNHTEYHFKYENGKYYYRYLVETVQFPYDGGWAWCDLDTDIILNVYSSPRAGDNGYIDDLTGADVYIYNNTGKTVVINTYGDDVLDPRFKLISYEGDVTLTINNY